MLHTISHAIRHEFGTKVFAILLASALWVYVIGTENPVRRETIARPVLVIRTPSGLDVVQVTPEVVGVQVSGRLQELKLARSAALRVVADASQARAGSSRVELRVEGALDRVVVHGPDPPTVLVWLDHRISRDFRVNPATHGTPGDGREVWGQLAARPARVAVSGPRATLESIAEVSAPVDVTGFAQTRSTRTRLQALDNHGAPVQGITFDPPEALVTVPIMQVETRRVPVHARLTSPAPGYVVKAVSTDPGRVTLKGPPETLRGISEVWTRLQDIRGVRDSATRSAHLAIPAGTWPTDDAETVTLHVTVSQVASRAASPATSGEGTQGAEQPPAAATEAPANTPAKPGPPAESDSPTDAGPGHGTGGATPPAPTRPTGEAPGRSPDRRPTPPKTGPNPEQPSHHGGSADMGG